MQLWQYVIVGDRNGSHLRGSDRKRERWKGNIKKRVSIGERERERKYREKIRVELNSGFKHRALESAEKM